jgi:flagellar protein FlaI
MDVVEEYLVSAEGATANVTIRGEGTTARTYDVSIPRIAAGTQALLEDIKRQLAATLSVSPAELLDNNAVASLKQKVAMDARTMLTARLPETQEQLRDLLVTSILNSTLGLGDIEYLLNDPVLEEIVIPSANARVRVYHKKHGWLETNVVVSSEQQVQNYASIIARRVGKQVTTLTPLLDAALTTGDRANAVLYPISSKGNTITIRKFAREPWTIVDLVTNGTISSGVAALLWTAIQYEMNILVSGGTASGKTSLLNVMLAFMPPNHRILSIEDTRELQLPDHLFWAPLTTRAPGPEGEGEVTMLDLLVNALRMRPDRIVLGEVRRQRDAEVMFEAMHTGHSVYATVHADSAQETIRRLVFPPISVPPNLLQAVNLNVVMFRDRRRGIRRVSQVAEFVTAEEGERVTVKPNVIYRWLPDEDTIVPFNNSLRFFEDLSRHTGLTQDDITANVMDRKAVLDWLVQTKQRDLASVGRIMQEFALDPAKVIRQARTALKRSEG